MRPRVWARAAPVDPQLPIRGRYLSLQIEAAIGEGLEPITLAVSGGALVAERTASGSASTGVSAWLRGRDSRRVAVLYPSIAYFIPEHAADPSHRPAGGELWVEVTIPRRGAPRPIRLGLK